LKYRPIYLSIVIITIGYASRVIALIIRKVCSQRVCTSCSKFQSDVHVHWTKSKQQQYLSINE